MTRFDGNRVLLLDSDQVSSRKVMLEMIKLGGTCSISSTFEGAKELIRILDFDLVLSTVELADGKLHDFLLWYRENVSETTLFAVVGAQAEEGYEGLPFIDQNLPFPSFLRSANELLFDFKEFEGNLSDLAQNNGVSFELVVDQKGHPVRPVEFSHNSMLLGTDKSFAPGSIAKLKVTFQDFKRSESFTLIGVLGKHQTDGQFFQIDQSYIVNWNMVTKYLAERQTSITKFMNKVAGN